jgi:hypothetical protein
MKTYGRMEAFLNPAVNGGERSALTPGYPPRGERRRRLPVSHFTAGWLGPRTDLDPVEEGKLPRSCRDWKVSSNVHPIF